MLRLRFVALMLSVVLLSGGVLIGQDKKVGQDKKPDEKDPIIIKRQLPKNFSKLGLTDKQKKEVYKIRAKYAAKIEELNKQLKELKGKEKTDTENVLTAAQKARLKELNSGGGS
jgi:hypothetical protein